MSYTEGSGHVDDLDLGPIAAGSRRRAAGDDAVPPPQQRIASRPTKRLFLGQTAIDFWGRRRIGFLVSLVLIVIGGASLATRQLNLGIEFEGGVAYDIPADEFSVSDARDVLGDNGIDGSRARVEERRSSTGDVIKVQIQDQPDDVRDALQDAFADAAGVEADAISVASVSSTWGEQITRRAVIALIVFLILFSIVIAIRFEWRMSIAAIVAMIHDVAIAAGIYSLFGFEVTPPTVIAFLTILGYSLYDTIVVFDRVRENERRIAAAGFGAGDLVNVSTNQVLMRSVNTSISSLMPVIALLLIGAGLLGQVTLREFAIALFIGMLTGAYSSIFVATPLVGLLKRARLPERASGWLLGDELRSVVVRGVSILSPVQVRRRPSVATATAVAGTGAADAGGLAPTTEQLLSHAPRPRKKKRH